MANEKIRFARGNSSSLPVSKIAGRILFETDTGVLWIEDSSTSRVKVKDDTKLPLSGGSIFGNLEVEGSLIATLDDGSID